MVVNKNCLALLFLLFIVNYTNAQDSVTFQIIRTSTISNIEVYINALENANLEIYRCRTVNDTLHFENGISYILFSAERLESRGLLTDISDYSNPEERSKRFNKPIFRVSPEGILLAPYITIGSK